MADIITGRKPFIQLTDVPSTYAGAALNFVRVNAAMTGLEFAASAAVLSFLDLTDTPNTYVGAATNRVVVDPVLPQLIFVPDTFLEEQDTPNSYVGQALRLVRVNAGETGLEFAALSTVLSFLDLTDTPNSYVGQAGNFVNVNAGETELQFVGAAAVAGVVGPLLIPEITNKGRFWVSHGDNVITLKNDQLDNNFIVKAKIYLPRGSVSVSGRITYRGVYHAGSARANSMAIVARPDTIDTIKIRLEGGFGYVSGGFVAAANATVDRLDDVANTQTATTGLGTARYNLAGFSLNGYGFTAGGLVVNAGQSVVERLDDAVAATQTARAGIFARGGCAGFSLNGYGFVCGGTVTQGTTSPNNIVERFDDIINSWVGRSGLITSRWELAGYSLNGYGFTSGGNTAIATVGGAAVATNVTEKFDDIANSWSSRAVLTTARLRVAGYSMNGFGFTEQGYSTSAAANTTVAERFNDVLNIQESRTGPASAYRGRAGHALNGFGFASGGFIAANSANVDRRDDLANTFTARTAITVAREMPTGDATNEYFVDYNTENVSEFDEVWNVGTTWIAHGDNVITLYNRHNNLDFRSDVVLELPIGNSGGANMVTYRGVGHTRPMTVTCRPDDPYIGFGFTSGGFVAAFSAVTERYDDPTQVTTTRTALGTARSDLQGYSFGGFGFTTCGNTGAVSGVTERLDDSANVQTVRTPANTARRHLASFVLTEGNGVPLNNFGHTACGFVAAVSNVHEEFDDIANLQTVRGSGGLTARDRLAGFSINQYGFTVAGTTNDAAGGVTNLNERYDLIADTWSSRTVLPVSKYNLAGFAFGGFGYASGGTTNGVAMLATTHRYDNVTDAWLAVGNLNTARDRFTNWAIQGFGFSACGNTTNDAAPTNSNVVNRYDPSTTTWTARTPAPALTARRDLAGYANPTRDNSNGARLLVRLHGGFGFTSGGFIAAQTGTTERYDDVTFIQLARTAITARYLLAGYSLNGLGFTSCGYIFASTGITERFDDVLNTAPTVRTAATARQQLTGYSLNGYGFTSCGFIAAVTGTTERFDDTVNSQTARNTATARDLLAGYSLNGFGFTSCGFIAAETGITERFDDTGNFHITRNAATARQQLTGYSLNGYGFTSGGILPGPIITGTTERFDDIANIQGSRASLNTARWGLSGYSLNGFGFTSGGSTGINAVTTERFDDISNIHTVVTPLNTARRSLTGYSTNEYFVNYSTMD